MQPRQRRLASKQLKEATETGQNAMSVCVRLCGSYTSVSGANVIGCRCQQRKKQKHEQQRKC